MWLLESSLELLHTSPGARIRIRLYPDSPDKQVVILGKPYEDGEYYVDKKFHYHISVFGHIRAAD